MAQDRNLDDKKQNDPNDSLSGQSGKSASSSGSSGSSGSACCRRRLEAGLETLIVPPVTVLRLRSRRRCPTGKCRGTELVRSGTNTIDNLPR